MKTTSISKFGLAAIVALSVVGSADADIVFNGSFEQTVVNNGGTWDIFPSIPGWQLSRGPGIELQRGVSGWLAAEGAQYIELDSDIDGPGGPLHGEDASSAVYQDLATVAGQIYELTFAFSPRPGVADNALEIKWGGAPVDVLTADGSGRGNTAWQYHTYQLTAPSDSTRLEFGDLSVSDSLGTFVDDVSVTVVPEPAGLALLTGGLVLGLRRRMI